jgi:hypothetical protein
MARPRFFYGNIIILIMYQANGRKVNTCCAG